VPFDPVDHLDYFDLARQNGEERWLSALMNGKFSRIQVQVSRRTGETF
jgi:hypothetical protein